MVPSSNGSQPARCVPASPGLRRFHLILPAPQVCGIILGMLVLGFCADIIGRKWGSR